MARVKEIFLGAENSVGDCVHLECYQNTGGNLFISIEAYGETQSTALDRSTAIALINKMGAELNFDTLIEPEE